MCSWVQLPSVNLALRPLSEDHERSIRNTFESTGFARLMLAIEAEYHIEAHRIAESLCDLVFTPDTQPDRSLVDRSAKLKAALEILEEFRGEEKEFCELIIES